VVKILEVAAVKGRAKPGTVESSSPLRIGTGRGLLEVISVSSKGAKVSGAELDWPAGFRLGDGADLPLVDLKANYRGLQAPIDAAIREVLDKTCFIGGPPVDKFEKSFAEFIGVEHCVGVNSGTDALYLAYHFLGLEGAEVVVQGNSFVATLLGLSRVNADIRLTDVDERTQQLTLPLLQARVTEKTRAIVVVHMHGHMCPDMEEIMTFARAKKLLVIEDTSQAHGAKLRGKRAGSFGDASAFSFYPGKNLGAFGDGGAICTNDAELARKVNYWRAWGAEKKYHHTVKGGNSRLDSLQAAVLSVKLSKLDELNASRRRLAKRYHSLLAGLPVRLPVEPDGVTSVWHLYIIATAERDPLLAFLHGKRIQAGIHYPIPLHLLGAYKELACQACHLGTTAKLADEILSLPLFPEMTDTQQDSVCSAIREYFLLKSK
jgi:dTDP-4-amino-4,6-dideoxygalactose transaminase